MVVIDLNIRVRLRGWRLRIQGDNPLSSRMFIDLFTGLYTLYSCIYGPKRPDPGTVNACDGIPCIVRTHHEHGRQFRANGLRIQGTLFMWCMYLRSISQ